MAVYDPRLFFSTEDRELLRLLALIVLEQEGWAGPNTTSDGTHLTQNEAHKLVSLLQEFVASKKFRESAYLTEGLFGAHPENGLLRDLYLKGRRSVGRSRAVAHIQWENLLGRIGIWPTHSRSERVWYQASATPMSMEHFLKMERRLAIAADIHPAVRDLIDRYVKYRLDYVEKVRTGSVKMEKDQVFAGPNNLLGRLKTDLNSPIGISPIKTNKIIGVMTIVMDLGSLYTTRDWSVASFLSQIAGSIPFVALD